MESTDKVKRLGDKELEYLILRFVSEHPGAKESDVCKAIPARPLRVADRLKDFVSGGVLELKQDDSSYTVRCYTLTEPGEFVLSLKAVDCAMMHKGFGTDDIGDLDLRGRDLSELTRMLKELREKGTQKRRRRGSGE